MPPPNDADLDALEHEAFAWLARITSGAATDADRAALMQWRRRGPAHERAFQHAARLWRQVGRVGPVMLGVDETRPAPRVGRRRFLQMGAAAAAGAGILVGGAKLGFWPYLGEVLADHHTMVGEQRRLSFDDRVSVELNTRSSLSVDRGATPERLTLLGGEAAFTVRAGGADGFVLTASSGLVSVDRAVFVVRCDAPSVRVTCIEGAVDLIQPGPLRLGPGEQAVYEGERLLPVAPVDLEVVTGWRRGLLVFRNEPLEAVVAELNRYRKGLIVIADRSIAKRRVTGVFHLDRTDEALAHIESSLGAPIRRLSRYFTIVG